MNDTNPRTQGRPTEPDNPPLVRQMFSSALKQHRADDLEQAEQGYREVLAARPDHADSLPIAHLAGALGGPVWLLDRFGHCWRWLAGRRDSPWYPAMRSYRQPAPGDWDSVIAEVTADLHQLADAWRAALADARMPAPEHA